MRKAPFVRAVVSLAVVSSVLMPVSTATAAAGAECPDGKFCLFTGQGSTGGMVARDSYDDDLHDSAVGYTARSWRNNTGDTWYVFAGTHCTGVSTPLGPRDAGDVNTIWYGNIRSISDNDSDDLSDCRD